jgi:hypothetical protein
MRRKRELGTTAFFILAVWMALPIGFFVSIGFTVLFGQSLHGAMLIAGLCYAAAAALGVFAWRLP